MREITIIIPARKNSKSIKNKNRVIINGLPLVEYSIITAKLCKYAKKIFLSSDDEIILDIGRKHKIDVIERPEHLATDTAKTIDVVKHVIANRDVTDDILLLEPTSPLRTLEDINNGIEQYFSDDLDSLYSLSQIRDFCFAHVKEVDENGIVKDVFVKEIEGVPRQYYNKKKYYMRDGVFYLFKKRIVNNDNTLYGKNSKGFIIKNETVDINNLDNTFKAERLLNLKKFEYVKSKKLTGKVIYIDIDDTICRTPENLDYSKAIPIVESIKKANKLFDEGNIIVYWTARGIVTGINWREVTEEQFKNWDIKYHELKFGKPNFDLFINDRVLNIKDWKF